MKKDKKPETFAVIENYNFHDRHTDTQTDRLYFRPGPEGRIGENRVLVTDLQCLKMIKASNKYSDI